MKTLLMSITGLVMRRFPEQLAPVLDLGLDRTDASEELGEVGNFLRPRREREASIIEPCQEIIEARGGLLPLLPQRRRLPLVGIGGLDRRFKRVGDGLEQHGGFDPWCAASPAR